MLLPRMHVNKSRSDTNRTRLVRKAKPTDSFFNFFSPPQPPNEDDDAEGDELEELEEKLEMDYQIGEDIKEKVGLPLARIPFPYGRSLMIPIVLDHYPCDRLLHRPRARVRGL